ncbi:MAG: hypothetical protein AABW90_03880 [Nanoarchaeota archaeon]
MEITIGRAVRTNKKNLKNIWEGYVRTDPFILSSSDIYYRKGNIMMVYDYNGDEIVAMYELKGHKIFKSTSISGLHIDGDGKFYLSDNGLKLDRGGLAGLIKRGRITLEISKEVIEYFQNMSKKSKLKNIGNH